MKHRPYLSLIPLALLAWAPVAMAQGDVDCSQRVTVGEKPDIRKYPDFDEFMPLIMSYKKRERLSAAQRLACPELFASDNDDARDNSVLPSGLPAPEPGLARNTAARAGLDEAPAEALASTSVDQIVDLAAPEEAGNPVVLTPEEREIEETARTKSWDDRERIDSGRWQLSLRGAELDFIDILESVTVADSFVIRTDAGLLAFNPERGRDKIRIDVISSTTP